MGGNGPPMPTTDATYSIEAAAAIIVGADASNQPVPGAVEWVRRRLIRGEFTGFKAARRWRMTDSDITAAIESLRPTRADTPVEVLPDAPMLTTMTARSRRRMAIS